jgi:hypothetical protein
MSDLQTYKIDFVNVFTRSKITINLTSSKEESKKKLKIVGRRFSFLWRRSVIYC